MTQLARLFIHRDGTVHADTIDGDWNLHIDGYETLTISTNGAFAVYRQDPHPTAREVAEAAAAWYDRCKRNDPRWPEGGGTTEYEQLKASISAWVEGGRR